MSSASIAFWSVYGISCYPMNSGIMDLVSIVITCHNPGPELLKTVTSAKCQTHNSIEIIVVNDGTDAEISLGAIRSTLRLVHQCIEQPNLGVSSARNAGFQAAKGGFVVPLDCGDLLRPQYVGDCLSAINAHPEAAFVYTDCRLCGRRKTVDRYSDYNFYDLLDRNTLPNTALIRKEYWHGIGGYDESLRHGYEDWEFWIRLGAKAGYGHHLDRVLFDYQQRRSPSDMALNYENEAREYIEQAHRELYTYDGRARNKAVWKPTACVVGPAARPAILDCESIDAAVPADILRKSRAPAFAISRGAAQPWAAEFAALAVWGGSSCVQLPDGSLAASRRTLGRCRDLSELRPDTPVAGGTSVPLWRRDLPRGLEVMYRHLGNAGLLGIRPWLKHPLRFTLRLVPLRLKEDINRRLGRTVFDLSFYLQFQPTSVTLGKRLSTPLTYLPRLDSSRRRIALITPHLGPGGAETVLFEIAGTLDRDQFEIFLIATQSSDSRWQERWQQAADHLYDLSALVPPEQVASAVYSIAKCWRFETLLIQNSLAAYSVLPELKATLHGIKVMDLVHSVDERWDVVSCTNTVADSIDIRIVISEAARASMRRGNTPEERIRLIRAGIDLARFAPGPRRCGTTHGVILFAGRLDPVKRPLLLVEIAVALKILRGRMDFRMIVAGDGPEAGAVRTKAEKTGLSDAFEFLGHVPDIAPLLAGVDLLVLPSRAEGIPLAILEGFAAGKPAVVSNVGAVSELVDVSTGFLIENVAGEVDAFAKAIDALLNSPDLRARMGEEARRKAEARYSQEAFRQNYRALFSQAPRTETQ
jgi:glycosyltransferase involved in cell wall biosynthesis